ncbi:hypothetical protein Tco_1042635 [Tanacetum coccineum]|uniref:RNase H type-1 domain-containing protein n=1 Tax=Tanacetum coccineum TaxID=301880 RepID=A0ABQ5GKA9_9ASTR
MVRTIVISNISGQGLKDEKTFRVLIRWILGAWDVYSGGVMWGWLYGKYIESLHDIMVDDVGLCSVCGLFVMWVVVKGLSTIKRVMVSWNEMIRTWMGWDIFRVGGDWGVASSQGSKCLKLESGWGSFIVEDVIDCGLLFLEGFCAIIGKAPVVTEMEALAILKKTEVDFVGVEIDSYVMLLEF